MVAKYSIIKTLRSSKKSWTLILKTHLGCRCQLTELPPPEFLFPIIHSVIRIDCQRKQLICVNQCVVQSLTYIRNTLKRKRLVPKLQIKVLTIKFWQSTFISKTSQRMLLSADCISSWGNASFSYFWSFPQLLSPSNKLQISPAGRGDADINEMSAKPTCLIVASASPQGGSVSFLHLLAVQNSACKHPVERWNHITCCCDKFVVVLFVLKHRFSCICLTNSSKMLKVPDLLNASS